jgi:hypothetical protein
MADEYALTHKLIFLKNKRAGSVPNLNYVQNRILLITILINQNQVLGRKNKNSYRPPEINKGESPKSCSYCKRKDRLFQNVLEINNESISQDSIACNALKDPLIPIVIENANLRFPKCQFDIVENYKPFIKPVYNSLKYCLIRELSKPKR